MSSGFQPCRFPPCVAGSRGRHPLSVAVVLVVLLLGPVLTASRVYADTLTVAVAANFAETLEVLARDFEQQSVHRLRLVRGSSGRHFAQIVNGAPFELYFSADAARPAELRARLDLRADSLRTYAQGRLVLWGPQAGSEAQIRARLEAGQFDRLALANPRLAPYGQAAVETLDSLGLAALLTSRATDIVRGESVAQAYQFVATANAALGFVAYSQVKHHNNSEFWLVPEVLHEPIVQQLLVVRDTPAVRQFLAYLESPRARRLILEAGYGVPESGAVSAGSPE